MMFSGWRQAIADISNRRGKFIKGFGFSEQICPFLKLSSSVSRGSPNAALNSAESA
jgi:hypothetical protein